MPEKLCYLLAQPESLCSLLPELRCYLIPVTIFQGSQVAATTFWVWDIDKVFQLAFSRVSSWAAPA
eukprot:5622874-Amphidinium_carterae.2